MPYVTHTKGSHVMYRTLWTAISVTTITLQSVVAYTVGVFEGSRTPLMAVQIPNVGYDTGVLPPLLVIIVAALSSATAIIILARCQQDSQTEE